MAGQEQERVEAAYRRLGRRWVWNVFSFAGFQGWEPIIRRRAVARLQLQPRDAVLDLACGRGANLPYLVRAVGAEGWVLGLDYSATMLRSAQELTQSRGWRNVELVRGDAAGIELRTEFDGALCTLGFTVIPGWREAMRRMAAAVRPGKRLVVFDGRIGRGLKRVWNPYIRLLARIAAADPTRDVPAEFRKLATDVREETMGLSDAYILTGVVPESR